jgi:Putative 2OG-Fe(II) oxygenase
MNEILPLFSSPVFKRSFDIRDIDVNNIEWERNTENEISKDIHVLDDPKYSRLRTIALYMSRVYFYEILKIKPSIELYITTSWFNRTKNGQRHHRHTHPNSVLSGVLYISGDNFHTTFASHSANHFEFDKQEGNIWNSNICGFKFERGECVVFQSNTIHHVPEYTGETPRITLSWNTYVRGDISTNPTSKLHLF